MALSFEDDLCEIIASHYPFSAQQVKEVHTWAKSWDLTLATLNMAVSSGYRDPLVYASLHLEALMKGRDK